MKTAMLVAVMVSGAVVASQAQNEARVEVRMGVGPQGKVVINGVQGNQGGAVVIMKDVVIDLQPGPANAAPAPAAVEDGATRQGKVKDLSAADKRFTLTTQEAAVKGKKAAEVDVALTYNDATTIRTATREDKTVKYVPAKMEDLKAGLAVTVIADKDGIAMQITIEPETEAVDRK